MLKEILNSSQEISDLTNIFGGNARSYHSNLERKNMLSNKYVTSHDIYASDIYYPMRYMAEHSYAERNIEQALGTAKSDQKLLRETSDQTNPIWNEQVYLIIHISYSKSYMAGFSSAERNIEQEQTGPFQGGLQHSSAIIVKTMFYSTQPSIHIVNTLKLSCYLNRLRKESI